MESLRDLNKICQKPNYKTSGNWMVRTFLRDAALPCTWLLLHTPVTADQVTSAALLVGLAACFFISLQGGTAFLTGALLLQFWYYLDHVDGQIARYRKTASTTGRFYDFLMHHVVHTLLVFSLGISFSNTLNLRETGIFMAAAIAFMMSLFNFMHDIKSKAFIERLMMEEHLRKRRLQPSAKGRGTGGVQPSSALKRFFSCLHKSCEIHVMMNLLTGLAVIQILLSWKGDFRVPIYLFYAVSITVISLVKMAHFIIHRKADTEFLELFEVFPADGTPNTPHS